VYNSSKGADLRWTDDGIHTSYTIMRKENGVWKEVAAVEKNMLQTEGSDLKYIDREVEQKYGKGFIYSIAIRDETGVLRYDQTGLPLYRLEVPVVTSVRTNTKDDGTIEVIFELGKTDCHGYELQVSFDSGGSWKKFPEVESNCSSITVYGLEKGRTYIYRFRSQKTNKDRGTTWSQYTSWIKVSP
jgi:hypothetical protein